MPTLRRHPGKPIAGRRHNFLLAVADKNGTRTIAFRPWLVATIIAVAVAVAAPATLVATNSKLAARNDALTNAIAKQARVQTAYENRVVSLRDDIKLLTSHKLLDEKTFGQKLEKLFERQATLDARHDVITELTHAARRAGLIPPPTPIPRPVPNPIAPANSRPLITGSIEKHRDGGAVPIAPSLQTARPTKMPDALETIVEIKNAEESLDEISHRQAALLAQIAAGLGQRTVRLSTLLADLGHPVVATNGRDGSDIGGPFVVLPSNDDPDFFRSHTKTIAAEIERLTLARNRAVRLPLGRPVGDARITSGFGKRLDPFLRRPALHTGTDFKARKGKPVHSTATGTVVAAGVNGGYGLMVEIDHGHGITTRYGHLSRISVAKGEKLKSGTVVGRVGSTGRSTGPHLHYEVRIKGKAVNPIRYIRAGSKIRRLL